MANVRISDLTSEVDLGKVQGLVGYINTTTQGVYDTVKITGDPLNSSKNFVVYSNSSDIPTTGSPALTISRTELSPSGLRTYQGPITIEASGNGIFKATGLNLESTFGYGNAGSNAITLKTKDDAANQGSILISSNGGGSGAILKLRSKKDIQIDLHTIGSATAPVKGSILKAKDATGNVEWGTIENPVAALTLEGTTASSTSRASYGINTIDTATTSNLATRLPDPVTGQQLTFVNNSKMSILVFPSTTGGKINGVIDGYASIPNDGRAYTFNCVANPTTGAWVWSPPATGQIQLPTISIAHTNGTATNAWGVGKTGAQLINPTGSNWYDNLSVTGFPTLTFNVISGSAPGEDYWSSLTGVTGTRQLVNTKVYSNYLDSDSSTTGLRPVISRFVAYELNNGFANHSASQSMNFNGGIATPFGPLHSPVEVGDVGTIYNIQPANLVQVSPATTDDMGDNNYFTFRIVLHPSMATKTYKFDIFLEHT